MRDRDRRDPRRSAPKTGLLALAVWTTLVVMSATFIVTTTVASARESDDDERVGGSNSVGRILGTFRDSSGKFRNATNNPAVVNRSNAFFDTGLGTNGQACVTCHQPN